MPVNVVKTKADEKHWKKAKAVAKKQYKGKKGKSFWKIVMGIFKKMTGRSKMNEVREMAGLKPLND